MRLKRWRKNPVALLSRQSQDRNSSGFALVSVVLIIVLLTVLSGGVYFSSVFNTEISNNRRSTTEAFYLAEAGLQRALHQTAQDPDWPETLADASNAFAGDNQLGSGTYVVEVFDDEPQSGWIRIRSTGNVGGSHPSSSTIEGTAQKPSGGAYPEVFDYAIFACNNLESTGGGNSIRGGDIYVGGNYTLKAGTNQTQGNIYAHGNAKIADQGQVVGNVSANGDIEVSCRRDPCIDGSAVAGGNIKGKGTITGEASVKVKPKPVSDLCEPTTLHDKAVTSEHLEDLRAKPDQIYEGDQAFSNQSLTHAGVLEVQHGNLRLNGNIQLAGDTIFLIDDGDVFLEGPAVISSNPPGAQVTFLVPNGTLHVNGGHVTVDGVIQVGSVSESGAVSGGDIRIEPGSGLQIDGSMAVLKGNIHMANDLQVDRIDPTDPRLALGTLRAEIRLENWREIRN